ncbi:MAG: GntR family transcriptional regulator [Planctomycetota bacterium]
MAIVIHQSKPKRRLPARGEARRFLSELILSDNFASGGLLPSERELSSSVGVSRPTVRLVLEELSQEGRISRIEGRGWAVPQAEPKSLMGQAVLLVTELHGGQRSRSGLMAGIVDEISGAASEAELDTLAVDASRLGGDRLTGLIKQPPGGAIFAVEPQTAPAVAEPICELLKAGVPVVAYGSSLVPEACDRVVSDHVAGTRGLVEFLARRGRRRLLRVWAKVPAHKARPYWLNQRDEGYEAGCRDAGLDVLPALEFFQPVTDGLDDKQAFEAKVRLMMGYLFDVLKGDDQPDAILVNSDGVAFAAAQALRALGLDPHADIPIVGYDNYFRQCPEAEMLPDFQPLATVDKGSGAIGEAIVGLLADRAAGQINGPSPVTRAVQPTLVTNPFFPNASPVSGPANTGTQV